MCEEIFEKSKGGLCSKTENIIATMKQTLRQIDSQLLASGNLKWHLPRQSDCPRCLFFTRWLLHPQSNVSLFRCIPNNCTVFSCKIKCSDRLIQLQSRDNNNKKAFVRGLNSSKTEFGRSVLVTTVRN